MPGMSRKSVTLLQFGYHFLAEKAVRRRHAVSPDRHAANNAASKKKT